MLHAPVGDAVAEDDERRVVTGGPSLDRAEEVPVLGVGCGGGEGRCADAVAGLHVRGRAAAGVAGDAGPGLAWLGVEGDGDVGLRGHGEVDRVGVGDLAARDGDGGGAVVEGQGFERRGVDTDYSGLAARGEGDGRGR